MGVGVGEVGGGGWHESIDDSVEVDRWSSLVEGTSMWMTYMNRCHELASLNHADDCLKRIIAEIWWRRRLCLCRVPWMTLPTLFRLELRDPWPTRQACVLIPSRAIPISSSTSPLWLTASLQRSWYVWCLRGDYFFPLSKDRRIQRLQWSFGLWKGILNTFNGKV